MYECTDYAHSRLSGTMVKIDGAPAFIEYVGDDRSLLYRRIGESGGRITYLGDPSIDITPVSLGYVNYPHGATYLTRVPKRRWKQGIDREGISVTGSDFREGKWLESSEVACCIEGEYPTKAVALALAIKKKSTVAFSRKFAVDYNGGLFYRGKRVGSCDFKLDEVYSFLESMLQVAL